MTKKTKLINEIIRLAKIQPDFDADINEYRERLASKDCDDLERILHNKRIFCNPDAMRRMERAVEREIRKMDKGGMFAVGNLSPRHALD